MFLARQGDILFVEENGSASAGDRPLENPVLAYGEVTGHCHAIKNFAGVKGWLKPVQGGNEIWFRTEAKTEVTHDEHSTLTIPKGKTVRVVRQREYSSVEALRERQVRD